MYLIYLLRRDLRLSDNPIFHFLQSQTNHRYTHILPVYILPPHQIEVSGFLQDQPNTNHGTNTNSSQSPYPPARSRLGNFWRCGPHRVKFIAESIWDLKDSLKDVGSDLVLRVGRMEDVVRGLLLEGGLKGKVGGVWMSRDWGYEEMQEEREVRKVVLEEGKGEIEWRVWDGEEMLIHDDDFVDWKPEECPDVFTSFRKSFEPLRENIRLPYSRPKKLPPLPPRVPSQSTPFVIPDTFEDLISRMRKPLERDMGLPHAIQYPRHAESAHSFIGGETKAHERIVHLLTSGSMSAYKDTRNGLLGEDFSTKLSAYLALGCVTARQVNEYLVAFEDGKSLPMANLKTGVDVDVSKAVGYGKGENKGTAAVRFELLWRDYMRLCMRKYGAGLFSIDGFRGRKYPTERYSSSWADLSTPHTRRIFERFIAGETGIGLVDASMRELALTGYTSNRARQNCASFLAKWLNIDWRLGAEWYEYMLIDYDVSSNWGNWAYVAGVGNDPRNGKEGRRFNPVKQGWDYDAEGEYVRSWVGEFEGVPRGVEWRDVVFQGWRVERMKGSDAGEVGERLNGVEWVRDPLVRIEYQRQGGRGNGKGRGGGGGGGRGKGKGKGSRGKGGQRNRGRGREEFGDD